MSNSRAQTHSENDRKILTNEDESRAVILTTATPCEFRWNIPLTGVTVLSKMSSATEFYSIFVRCFALVSTKIWELDAPQFQDIVEMYEIIGMCQPFQLHVIFEPPHVWSRKTFYLAGKHHHVTQVYRNTSRLIRKCLIQILEHPNQQALIIAISHVNLKIHKSTSKSMNHVPKMQRKCKNQ